MPNLRTEAENLNTEWPLFTTIQNRYEEKEVPKAVIQTVDSVLNGSPGIAHLLLNHDNETDYPSRSLVIRKIDGFDYVINGAGVVIPNEDSFDLYPPQIDIRLDHFLERVGVPVMASSWINSAGEFIKITDRTYLGGFYPKEALYKVQMTDRFASFANSIPELYGPEIIMHGKYESESGVIVYRRPVGFVHGNEFISEGLAAIDPKAGIDEKNKMLLRLINTYGSALSKRSHLLRLLHHRKLLHWQLHSKNWGFSLENASIYIGDLESLREFGGNKYYMDAINNNVAGTIKKDLGPASVLLYSNAFAPIERSEKLLDILFHLAGRSLGGYLAGNDKGRMYQIGTDFEATAELYYEHYRDRYRDPIDLVTQCAYRFLKHRMGSSRSPRIKKKLKKGKKKKRRR